VALHSTTRPKFQPCSGDYGVSSASRGRWPWPVQSWSTARGLESPYSYNSSSGYCMSISVRMVSRRLRMHPAATSMRPKCTASPGLQQKPQLDAGADELAKRRSGRGLPRIFFAPPPTAGMRKSFVRAFVCLYRYLILSRDQKSPYLLEVISSDASAVRRNSKCFVCVLGKD
jgi:hypothetical protein